MVSAMLCLFGKVFHSRTQQNQLNRQLTALLQADETLPQQQKQEQEEGKKRLKAAKKSKEQEA